MAKKILNKKFKHYKTKIFTSLFADINNALNLSFFLTGQAATCLKREKKELGPCSQQALEDFF